MKLAVTNCNLQRAFGAFLLCISLIAMAGAAYITTPYLQDQSHPFWVSYWASFAFYVMMTICVANAIYLKNGWGQLGTIFLASLYFLWNAVMWSADLFSRFGSEHRERSDAILAFLIGVSINLIIIFVFVYGAGFLRRANSV